MTLPNFYVVGTAKCGTSSLAKYFRQHPDVCFSSAHETNFFAFDKAYARGLDRYRQYYSHYKGEKVLGEKSWRYSCAGVYPKALERMLAATPRFKVIYVVRDPVARAVSMWRELRDNGQDFVDPDPNVAIAGDPLILDSMRYRTQIRRFEQTLGPDNVLILFYEDFRVDPDAFYVAICDFLEIRRVVPKAEIHVNRSEGQRSDKALLHALRRVGLDRALRRYSPTVLRDLARRTLKRPIGKVSLSPAARAKFLDQVGEECAAILEIGGKPPDFWSLA